MMDEKRIEAAYVKIQDLLAKGTAKLIGWPLVTTGSGEKATVEAVDEIRYATEYDPPCRNRAVQKVGFGGTPRPTGSPTDQPPRVPYAAASAGCMYYPEHAGCVCSSERNSATRRSDHG